MGEHIVQKSCFLTVSECKRLIAKGVAAHPLIKDARENGIITVAKGTTNSYVVEELTGMRIQRTHYCTGTSQPSRGRKNADVANKLHDLILVKGEREEGPASTEKVEEMGPDDVFLKGANALNYADKVAGILIGHPQGGTIGAALGRIIAKRITLMIPVGLEKQVPFSIRQTAAEVAGARRDGHGPTLWPVQGEIVTELEALRILTGVRAVPMGAGGINGGEGGLWLGLFGSAETLEKAEALLDEVFGEPPFIDLDAD